LYVSYCLVNEQVRSAFFDCNNSGNGRFIIARIENESEIKFVKMVQGTSDWRSDLDLVPSELDATEPAYILFRTDNQKQGGYSWLFFAYVPDKAKVRQKMTYSSSRSTLKLACGGVFDNEIFGTNPNEFSKQGFEEWEASQAAPAPLTEAEEIKQSVEYNSTLEQASYESVGSTTSMVHGVAFEPDSSAINALKELCGGGVNYVQLGLDLNTEKIIFVEKDNITLNDVSGKIPLEVAGFHFFRYDHDFMGEKQSPIVYIYSCPDGSGQTKSAPVKMRMLYSSSKGAAADLLSQFGASTALRLEVNEPNDVDSDTILTKLHPVAVEKKASFAKPKPVGRGSKRLLK